MSEMPESSNLITIECITRREYKDIMNSVFGVNLPIYITDDYCGYVINDIQWLKELSSKIKHEELSFPWEENNE